MSRHAHLVDEALLGSIVFSNHAIERFAERAGFDSGERRQIEPIARDLLLVEGRVVHKRPSWGRSSNTADLYLQTGEWLLYICQELEVPRTYLVVTIVSNANLRWSAARDRGLIFTPAPLPATAPPRRQRASWRESVVAGVRGRRDGGLLSAIRAAHRQRRQQLASEHTAALARYDRVRQEHQAARDAAYAKHRRLWSG
jgi:hypothetical protein